MDQQCSTECYALSKEQQGRRASKSKLKAETIMLESDSL